MKITVTTLNSVYEFDTDKQQTRRLSGVNGPRRCQTFDGEWQSYVWFTPPVVGDPMVIHYGPHILDSVITSPVEIIEELDVIEWSANTPPPEEIVVNGTTYQLVSVNDKTIPAQYSYMPKITGAIRT